MGGINGTGKLKCERRGRRLGAPFVGAGFRSLVILSRSAKNENAGCFACYAKTECAHRKYAWRFGENIALSIVDIVPRRRNENR